MAFQMLLTTYFPPESCDILSSTAASLQPLSFLWAARFYYQHLKGMRVGFRRLLKR